MRHIARLKVMEGCPADLFRFSINAKKRLGGALWVNLGALNVQATPTHPYDK
jgi:hypothetical protein